MFLRLCRHSINHLGLCTKDVHPGEEEVSRLWMKINLGEGVLVENEQPHSCYTQCIMSLEIPRNMNRLQGFITNLKP